MKTILFTLKKAWIYPAIFVVLGILPTTFALAQQPEAVIKLTFIAPVIDGIVDPVWENAYEYNIALTFHQETPTLGALGETTWKGLLTWDGLFILIKVADDVFSPAYEGTDPLSDWMYDKPEIYIDCNFNLKDGKGPNESQNGHYLIAPAPIKDQVNGGQLNNFYPDDISFSYMVSGSSYLVEYFIPFSKLLDKNGTSLDKTATIGFDIYIVDNDVKSPVRNRMVWVNDGAEDDNWNNMDHAGLITFELDPPPPEPVPIQKITLTPGSIPTKNGTLQMMPLLEPDWYFLDYVVWSVINESGKASISPTGLVTAISDGTVTVKATSWLNPTAEATTTIAISGQSTVGVNQLSDDQQLTIYPNPTSGKVKLVFSKVPSKGTYLTVMDVTGKTILKQLILNKEEWIDLKGNPMGVYLIRTSLKDAKVQRIILK